MTLTAGAAATAAGKTLTCATGTGVVQCIAAGVNKTSIASGVVASVSVTLASSVNATSVAIGVSGAMAASPSATGISVSSAAGRIDVKAGPPPSAAAAAYAMDEGTGSTVQDASSNGITGQIQGASWTNGRFGKALSFNGWPNYVDLGPASALKSSGSMSWSAWVYATGNPRGDGQIIALSDNTSGWQFKTSPDTGVRTFGVAIAGSSGSRTQRYSKTTVALNTWYHVAGVYDAAAKTLNVYVNGVLDNGVLAGAVPGAQVTPAINPTIGRRSGGYYFKGIIDNLRVYTRALSAAEVQSDMTTPISSGNAGAMPTLTSVHCTPATIASGGSSTCTVALSAAALAGGTSIAVSDSSTALTTPGSVAVAAGSSSAAFTATAGSVTTTQSVTLTASLNGKPATTSVSIAPLSPSITVTSVQCSPGTISSAGSSNCTVALSAAAPAGGSSVAISDNSAALTVPGSVTVAAGSSTKTFTATAGSVTTTTSVTITAALSGKSATTVLTVQPSTQTAGLAAAYAFDEGSGPTVRDTSTNGNTGQIQDAIWFSTGRFGKSLYFNGTSSYVDLGNPPSLQTTGSMSWSAWVYATGNPPDDGQIVAHSNYVAGWQFKTTSDTGVRTFGVSVTGASGSRTQRYSKTVLALNKWYYVAGVYNAAAKTLNIYVNGVLDDGVLRGTVPASQMLSNSNTMIGRRDGGYFFKGLIDNVRVYKRPLTAAEIQGTMTTAVTATTGGALAAAAQLDTPSAAPVETSPVTSGTAVPMSRIEPGDSMLACSPRLVNAGQTATCEIKGLPSLSAPLEIAVSSTSEQVKVPAVVVSRSRQKSLTFQVSVDEAAAQQSATIAATIGDSTLTDIVHVLPGAGPVLTVPRRQITKPGTLVSFTVKAADSTGAPVHITAGSVPPGASFDAATGRFDWTPAPSQLGSYAVAFAATNAAGQSSSAQVAIDVDSGKPSLRETQFACSPRAIATVEGRWLAADGAALADPSGASTGFAGTRVVVNGEHVPVLSANPTGVSFLCPALDAGTSLSIAVETPAGVTNTVTAIMRNASPSIFSVDVSGQAQGSVSFSNSADLAMPRNYQIPGHPAQPGDHVLIWVTGLGQNTDRNKISVAFGDITVNADDIQPAPGYAGVYMIGATVPPGVKFSDAVPVQITVTGGDGRSVVSNSVTAAIEPVR